MEGMLAKLRAGNRYDLIFPTSDYVNRLVKGNQLLRLDRALLRNGDVVYPFFDDPWYDPGSEHTVPYAMYTTGIAWREDRVSGLTGSWNDLTLEDAKGKTFMLDDFKEGIGQANLLNGYDLNTVDPGRARQDPGDARAPEGLPARVLHERGTEPSQRYGVGPSRLERRPDQRPLPGEGPGEVPLPDVQGGDPGRLGLHGHPRQRAAPRAPRCCSSTACSTRRTRPRTSSYFGYPMPVKGSEDAFAELASNDPAIEVSIEDLEKGAQFRDLPVAEKRLWDRVWTEFKA